MALGVPVDKVERVRVVDTINNYYAVEEYFYGEWHKVGGLPFDSLDEAIRSAKWHLNGPTIHWDSHDCDI